MSQGGLWILCQTVCARFDHSIGVVVSLPFELSMQYIAPLGCCSMYFCVAFVCELSHAMWRNHMWVSSYCHCV